MKSHGAWGSGSKLDAPWAALKSELVDMGIQHAQIAAKINTIFGYNSQAIRNPSGTAKPEQDCVCLNQYWGLCRTDVEVFQAMNVAYNFHHILKKNNITKDSLPLVVKFSGPDAQASEYHVLTDFYGKGETQILLRLVAVGLLDLQSYKFESANSGFPIVVATTQRVIKRIIRNISQALHIETHMLDKIHLVCFKLEDAGEECEYIIALGETVVEEDVSTRIKTRRSGVKKSVDEPIELPFGLEFIPSENPDDEALPHKKAKLAKPKSDDEDESSECCTKDHVLESESMSSEASDESSASAAEKPTPLAVSEPSPSVPPLPAPPAAAPMPILGGPHRPGIAGFEKDPRGVAKCWQCYKTFGKGTFRVVYQIAKGKSYDSQRRVHIDCAYRLPRSTRPDDVRATEHMLSDSARSAEERAALTSVLNALNS